MWSKLGRRAALSCLAIALMLSLTPFHASNTVVQASTANLIHEDFSVDASRFAAVSGGTWSVSGGRYALTSAANGVPLGNVSVHQTEVEGDFTLSALGHVADATAYDDFAIVFGYQDANNYYYVSFNEFNDASTHGIFKVAAGTKTELADLGAVIAAGTDYGIEIERAGSDIAVYLDGTLRALVSDTGARYGHRRQTQLFIRPVLQRRQRHIQQRRQG
ncbi:hypothetical protein FE782_08985 [Paenibacillus antri]|uniref:LamG domain-containing protein n=1 Tax=Paenibacillus antri TaxID=2582848 RepID=A0A5R9GF39_9BACL|nr:hypothetical protein [Paenibacillus antri]TLS52750.1 hypothetical protein FE782_08985 [Paenibacillus antri]